MPEKTPVQPTIKHHFIAGAIASGIVLVVIFLFWFTFKIIPAVFSNGSNFVATSLSSTFVPNQTATTTTTTSTTQTQETSATVANTSANTAKSTYSAPAVSYYGLPDLAVTFIASGIIDPNTKQFVTTNYAGQNDTVAIKFSVRNIGTNVAGPWDLRLNMPSRTTPYYDGGLQPALKPGEQIDYVASFDSPITQGINTAYITADPMNLIAESNESNNSLTVPLNIMGTTYTYNNNYNYGTVAPTANQIYGTVYTWTNINGSCYANTQTAYPGDTVTWIANASGGNGHFTYSWGGSDGLTGSNNVENETYYTAGEKTAVLTLTSNGHSVTEVCSVNIL